VDVAPTLLAGQNEGGGDRFPGMTIDTCESLIAFSCKDHGGDAMVDIAPTLRAMGHDSSHPNAGGQIAVAFRSCGQDGFVPRGVANVVAPPLKAQSGSSGLGDGAPLLSTWIAVRRLTPRECERLQGFPDDWTLVPTYRQKLRPEEIAEMASYLGIPIDDATAIGATPDGPRYKAIGNSMAVPVMRWIGGRIDHVDRVLRGAA
jgi:DNA (cytosine-5)-methyltransferase 1